MENRCTVGVSFHNTTVTRPASNVQKPAALELYWGKKRATITITLNAAVRDRPIMMVPKILETLIASPKVKMPLTMTHSLVTKSWRL